jgi:hypothetical protein
MTRGTRILRGGPLAPLTDNWISNRVFKPYDDIVDHRCDTWNKFVDQPWRIMSIGLRDWAHRFWLTRVGTRRMWTDGNFNGCTDPAERRRFQCSDGFATVGVKTVFKHGFLPQ